MSVFIRLYAQCGDAEQAIGLQQRLLQALSPYARCDEARFQPYWKIPEWYGFELDFKTADKAVFAQLQQCAADGWTHYGAEDDLSAVWNPAPQSAFLIPECQWAEIQYYLPAPN